jgi:hypothetical protein
MVKPTYKYYRQITGKTIFNHYRDKPARAARMILQTKAKAEQGLDSLFAKIKLLSCLKQGFLVVGSLRSMPTFEPSWRA